MHKWGKKINQDYTKRTESAEHNKTVLMQQLLVLTLKTENKLNSVEIKNIHMLCRLRTQTFICDVTFLYPFFLIKLNVMCLTHAYKHC